MATNKNDTVKQGIAKQIEQLRRKLERQGEAFRTTQDALAALEEIYKTL